MTGTVVVHGLQGFTALQCLVPPPACSIEKMTSLASPVPAASAHVLFSLASHVPGVVRRELDDLLPSVTSRFFFTGPRREAAPATLRFHVACRTGIPHRSRPLQVFRP
ncbi:hypothetical protein NL676_036588 [Syzygium grande]|nr:hypothetical protein NL676_036588 [Syzygium grande]